MIKYPLFHSSYVKKDEADTTVQFQQCIKILADKVYLLTR
jgi:autophagy-related protein 11